MAGTSDFMKPILLPVSVVFPEALVIPAVHKDHCTAFLALPQCVIYAQLLIVGTMGNVIGGYQK